MQLGGQIVSNQQFTVKPKYRIYKTSNEGIYRGGLVNDLNNIILF